MARGDDSDKSKRVPPRRNPFRTKIKSPEELRQESNKELRGRDPVRVFAPARRYQHDPADFELLSVDLGQQIGYKIRDVLDRVEKEVAPGGDPHVIANIFEKRLLELGFLSPSVEKYLEKRYQDPAYKSPEEVAQDIAQQLAGDIMAYSEAKDGMPYGTAHREMVALLHDSAGEWEVRTIIKNFTPLVFKN